MSRRVQLVVALAILFATAAYVAVRAWQDPERRYQAARAAWRANDLQTLERELARLQGNKPYTTQRAFLQGALLLKQGHLDAALDQLRTCYDHPDLKLEAFVLSGQALYQMGLAGNAKLQWEQALRLDPNALDAHRWLGAMYFDLGAMDQALAHLQRVSELDPRDARADRLAGLINKDYERPHLAIPQYRRSLERDPQQADAENVRLELAECEFKQREFESALATLEKCPPSVRKWTIQGQCHLSLGRPELAAELVDQALAEAPQDLDAGLLKMSLLLAAGEIDAAVALAAQSVEQHPHDYHARFQYAQTLRRQGKDEEAARQEQVSEELRQTWSRFSDLHIEAIDQPTNADLRLELGQLAKKLGQLKLARTWFQAALAINPASEQAARELELLDAEG